MLVEKKVTEDLRVKKIYKYEEDELIGTTALKKHEIVDKTISTGAQLTLLGQLVLQIGDAINLDTPEFAEGKIVFSKINEILSN